MNTEKKQTLKIIGYIAAAAALFAVFKDFTFSAVIGFLGKIFSLLMPFITGAVIAFVINVPMRAVERVLFPKKQKLQKLRRPLALIITLLAIILVIAAVMVIVIPQVVTTAAELGRQIPDYMAKAQVYIEGVFKDYPNIQQWIADFQIDWQSVLASVSGWVTSGLSSTINIAASAVSGVVSAAIGFVFAMYILLQKERLANQAKMSIYAILPEKAADKLLEICARAEKTFSSFLSGQCLEAVILGCMFAAAMLIFRMKYVALISILIAFMALIPIVGAFIGCAVGAFLLFMQDPMQAVWFVVMFLILQQIEGNLIYPKVVGESVGLPAIWVLFVVTLGGKLMGVFGMLVMIPASSVLYALFREFVVDRLRKKSARVQKMFFKRAVPQQPKDK
ncbi:MAG: AI-2E family transporter [Ruminococcus sp.]|nr:AI-2E family transporter [Ruminococcus sp.]MCM1382771.1 AI-2E family transporter [Muribaculaceae bacterium]